MQYKVFVSYVSEDRKRVRPFVDALEERGFEVFWDQKLDLGSDWRAEIIRELNQADCVVVLWSKASLKSAWVTTEASCGMCADKLLPVLLEENIKRDKMPFEWLQCASIAGWDDDPMKIDKVVDGIKRHLRKAKR